MITTGLSFKIFYKVSNATKEADELIMAASASVSACGLDLTSARQEYLVLVSYASTNTGR